MGAPRATLTAWATTVTATMRAPLSRSARPRLGDAAASDLGVCCGAPTPPRAHHDAEGAPAMPLRLRPVVEPLGHRGWRCSDPGMPPAGPALGQGRPLSIPNPAWRN